MDFSHLFTDWTVAITIILFVAIPLSIIYVVYLLITKRKEKKVELARKIGSSKKLVVPHGTLPRDFGQKNLFDRPAVPKTNAQAHDQRLDPQRIREADKRKHDKM